MSILIPAAIGLAGQIFGGAMSAAANRRNRRDLASRISRYEGRAARAEHRGALDDVDVQSTLSQAREGLRGMMATGRANAIRGGVTPQAQAAQQQVAGRTYTDILGQTLRVGQARKDALVARNQALAARLEDLQHQKAMQDARKWQTFMDNTGRLAGTLAQYLSKPGISASKN